MFKLINVNLLLGYFFLSNLVILMLVVDDSDGLFGEVIIERIFFGFVMY